MKILIPALIVFLMILTGPKFLLLVIIYIVVLPFQVRYDEKHRAKEFIGWSLEQFAERLNENHKLPRCMRPDYGDMKARFCKQNGYASGYFNDHNGLIFSITDGKKVLANDQNTNDMLVFDLDDPRCRFVKPYCIIAWRKAHPEDFENVTEEEYKKMTKVRYRDEFS